MMLNAASILAFASYAVVANAQVTSLPPSLPCSSTTMCTDILKTCGTTATMTYGGCFPACTPFPTFAEPPCPTASTTEAPVPDSTSSCNGSGNTVCVDSIKECETGGDMTYGG
ncbi:hypothetical protein MGN70_004426 [Eutypa lata]|nr:hypothetical protein MGN70_004426 [Eutypa lata]